MDPSKQQLKSLSLGKVNASIAVCAFLPGVMDNVHCKNAAHVVHVPAKMFELTMNVASKISHMEPKSLI